jgi:YidC/Oxa1 family membrane protein insertase
VTQKMTPMPGMDPVQQKIMLLMPAMMSVFFLWMPSGLVLYWLVMNVLQIGQQMYANRLPA